MTSDHGPSLYTEHYAMQAPNDINGHLAGVQAFNWGYHLLANRANGFTELDSDIPGTPAWAQMLQVVSPPVGAVADIVSGLDHHNQIISGDVNENGVVLGELKRLVAGATR